MLSFARTLRGVAFGSIVNGKGGRLSPGILPVPPSMTCLRSCWTSRRRRARCSARAWARCGDLIFSSSRVHIVNLTTGLLSYRDLEGPKHL